MVDRGASESPVPDDWLAHPDPVLALNLMGSFDWDLDAGTFHMDATAHEVFDPRPDEYDGDPMTLVTRVPPMEGRRLDTLVAQAMKDGSDNYGAYFRIRMRDGIMRWTHTQGPIWRDGTAGRGGGIGCRRSAQARRQESAGLAGRAGDGRGLRPHRGRPPEVAGRPRRTGTGAVPGVARLGPDPLAEGFDEARFAEPLAGERRQIKGASRDQSLIAGIGNAYSDEIPHVARMSPFKLASSLKPEEIRSLYEALRSTLVEAVERSRGLAAGWLKAEKKSGLGVHGRTGEPCPVCGDTIREVSFSDSSLQYCPTCQTGGRPLADRRVSRLLK